MEKSKGGQPSNASKGSGGGKSKSRGQKVSNERGTATNHKKNPGKRAHQGGS